MQTQSKYLRFSLFGLLYFTQGTVLGYFASLNALYLLSNGVDAAKIGIFSTIALIPFVIKILFGVLSDRFNFFGLGHRKPYILMGLIIQFIGLGLAAFINPGEQFWGFVALAFLVQMGMAFYDTCTDGLALDVTPESEKGILQGFMVGGRSVGVIVAASIAGLIAESSWQGVFYFLAILTLIPIPLFFFIREPARTTKENFNWSAFAAFKQARVLGIAAIGLIIFLVIVGANQWINPAFTERFQISFGTAGNLTSLWGIGCVIGALLGGWLMDKLGEQKTTFVVLGGVILSMIMLAFVNQFALAVAVMIFFGLAYGAGQASYFALAMKITRPEIAASMYSILMAVTNIGQGIGLGIGGGLAKNFGYTNTFLIFGAVMLLILPFFKISFQKTQNTLKSS